MRELLVVRRVEKDCIYASLAVNQEGCASCAISGSCSLKGNQKEIKIQKNTEILKDVLPGDIIIVDFKSNEAILSLIVYGLPLAFFIGGILIGYLLKFADIVSFFIGLAFAGIAYLLLRFIDKKYKIEVIDIKKGGFSFPKGEGN